MCPAPSSARSSRATVVTTAKPRPIRSTASATRSGSPGSSGSGRRVSTRQNPQARVQRSPLIMKVAVPSAQHSERLGHPASSHTVTRLEVAERALELEGPAARGAPGPAATPACGRRGRGPRRRPPRPDGPRSRSDGPLTGVAAGSGPAGAAPWSAGVRTGAPGPSPRLNGVRSLPSPRAASRHTTSARSHGRPSGAQRSTARATRASTTSLMVASTPSAASEVTGLSGIPQGTMWPNMAMSGLDVEGEAVHGAAPGEPHADGGDLAGSADPPGRPRRPGSRADARRRGARRRRACR